MDINFLADSVKNRQAIAFAKFKHKWLFSANPMKMCFFWYFLLAEFISALKTEQKSMVFEKYVKNGIENIYYHYFLFFVIFSESFKQKFPI